MLLALLLDTLDGVGFVLLGLLLYFGSIPLLLWLLFRTMWGAAGNTSLYLIYAVCGAVLLGGWYLEAAAAELLPFAALLLLALIVHVAKR